MLARLSNGGAPGNAVEVFVRPEAIALARPGASLPEHGNRLEGAVDSLLFNGAKSRVLVRASGALVEVDFPHLDGPHSGAAFGPGDPVELGWAPSRALAFAEG